MLLLAFAGVHALAIAASPSRIAPLVSQGFLCAAPLLATSAAVLRCRATSWRPSDGWSMAALAFLLWALGMAVPALADRGVTGWVVVDYGDILLFVMYAVPLTWVVATPFRHRDRPAIQAVDAVLATVLGGLFFTLIIAVVRRAGADTQASSRYLCWLFDVENLFLPAGLALRYWAASSIGERRLFGALLGYALVYAASAGFNNHVTALLLQLDQGSYLDLTLPLPFVLFAAMASRANARTAAPRRVLALRVRYVRSASPWLLCVAVLGAGLALARYEYALGVAGVGVGVLGYGVRNLLREVQFLEQRRRLRDQQLAAQALTLVDPLTGVPNRRAHDEAFAREWKRALRSGRPLGVLLIDIDFFKRLNDTLGHQAGDACLREVAQAMRGALHRPDDRLARYGGEEFVALLPETDRDGCAQVAEALRAAVAALQLANPGATSGQVTISVGAACETVRPDRERAGLLQAADEAVYAAKHGGRNRVVFAWAAASDPEPAAATPG